jgi:hypothetical protein
MTLDHFFAAARDWLDGSAPPTSIRALGPTPSSDADLAFYPWLVAHDQQRILGQLMPRVRDWVERTDVAWTDLVAAYVKAHPPAGFTVATVGAHLADWLAAEVERDPRLPHGLEAVADLGWTRYLARSAPDGDDVGLDRRVFVRRYAVDPVAIERALRDDAPIPVTPSTTWLVFRHEPTGRPRVAAATLASIAVLVAATGAPLTGALALPEDQLDDERKRLTERGVLPHGDAP